MFSDYIDVGFVQKKPTTCEELEDFQNHILISPTQDSWIIEHGSKSWVQSSSWVPPAGLKEPQDSASGTPLLKIASGSRISAGVQSSTHSVLKAINSLLYLWWAP